MNILPGDGFCERMDDGDLAPARFSDILLYSTKWIPDDPLYSRDGIIAFPYAGNE